MLNVECSMLNVEWTAAAPFIQHSTFNIEHSTFASSGLSHHSNRSAEVCDAAAMKRRRDGDVKNTHASIANRYGAVHHFEDGEIDEKIGDGHIEAERDPDSSPLAGAQGMGSVAAHAARRRVEVR